MSDPAHIDIINKIPEYKRGTKRGDKRKIKTIMRHYEFNDDVVENINDDFCNGWDSARYIIIEMLKDKYWKRQECIKDTEVDCVIDFICEKLENYLFEKYCIEGDTKIDEIIKGGKS